MTISFPISARVRAPALLFEGDMTLRSVDVPVRYGLVEHEKEGLILIDTGYGDELYRARSPALSLYRNVLRPRLNPQGDVRVQLALRGAGPADVRHIVLTHLHADHVCGLRHFTNATIHASRRTLQRWDARPSWRDLHSGLFRCLLPDSAGFKRHAIDEKPAISLPWGGGGHDILGDGSLIAVGLPGHMSGQIGVFLPKEDHPLFYAVDSAWSLASVLSERRPPWLERIIMDNRAEAQASRALVRAAHASGIAVRLCHDREQPW